jgi:hypothetical protein
MHKANFLDTQTQYENLGTIDIDAAFRSLEIALNNYFNKENPNSDTEPPLQDAFNTINSHYIKLTDINSKLQKYIADASKQIVETPTSKERYNNKVHPEESILAREPTFGLLPELRTRSLPYILAISVFMASLTIFLIFQTIGFTGQVNLPPSITAWLTSPASPVPYYNNPMVLSGVIILLVVVLIIFIILYFKSKNTNKN